MTKLEIIYDIREKLRIETDDEKFTNEYFSHLIDIKRMLLIKQTFSNLSKPIPIAYFSQICLDLEVANILDGCNSSKFGCELRTVDKIPRVMNITGREDLISVKTIDNLSTGFNNISIERFPYLGNNKHLSNQIYTAIGIDKKIHFFSGRKGFKLMTKVVASGVFESPSEASSMSCIDGPTCDEYGSEYPIEGYMANDIVNLIAKELGITILQIPEDEINDASDDRNKK